MSSSSISRRSGGVIALFVLIVAMRSADAQTALETAEVAVSGAEGAVLFVDGKEIGVLPLSDSMILPAGTHRFQLARRGQKAESDSLMLPAHRFADLHLRIAGRSVIAVLRVTPALLLLFESADLPPTINDAITQSVSTAARQENVRLLRGDRQQAFMRQKDVLLRCVRDDVCDDPIFEKGEISYVLSLELARDGSSDTQNYTMSAALLDVTTRESSRRAEERCASCSVDRVASKTGRLVARLLNESMMRPRDPAIAARHAKRRSTPDQIEPAQATTARRTERTRPMARLITGGVLLGSGILLGSFGGSALSLNGRCQDGSKSLDLCTSVYNTRAVGGGLLASGAALAVTGTVLLAVPARGR